MSSCRSRHKAPREGSTVNLWDQFSRLHPSVQITLVIGMVILLTAIAINHTAEENLVNLLLALQTIVINSKIPRGIKPN